MPNGFLFRMCSRMRAGTDGSIPWARRNSSKDIGCMSMCVMLPTGYDLGGRSPTPSMDPETIMSNSPVPFRNLIAVSASGQSCISSRKSRLLWPSMMNPGYRTFRAVTMPSVPSAGSKISLWVEFSRKFSSKK